METPANPPDELRGALSREDYENFLRMFLESDGAAKILPWLQAKYPPQEVARDNARSVAFRVWEVIGLRFRDQSRLHESMAIFSALYDHLCASQAGGQRVHKGNPLLWLLDCYWSMGFTALSKRYLMLTLCEDAISFKGEIEANSSGLYFRAVWRHGLSDREVKTYAKKIYQLYETNPKESLFPEWVLQELGRDWMDVLPSAAEVFVYSANRLYIRSLMNELGATAGNSMERVCRYILSCMPGCRTVQKARSHSSDYDIICSVDGFDVDFRSELGRYFVCECKDWDRRANFSTMAKFCRVLDSTKSRFGILFSKNGITGAGKTTNAEREQLKVFQDRGMVIVVIDVKDIERVANGENFISILRRKYERVRLDLLKEAP